MTGVQTCALPISLPLVISPPQGLLFSLALRICLHVAVASLLVSLFYLTAARSALTAGEYFVQHATGPPRATGGP